MKLTAILLTAACLNAAASGHSQSVTLSLKNAPLEQAFQEIKKQSGYSFLYNDKTLAAAQKVSIQVSDASLVEVLALCFKNQPLMYSIVDKVIIVKEKSVIPSSPGEDKGEILSIDVRGRVTNENGEPVRATVTVKGTRVATATNANGEFELKGIDENATIVITGISIETREIKVDGKTYLPVIIKTKITEQKEVVVTALGIEKRTKELGYSIAKISGDEISKTSPSNMLTGLTARVSGLSIATQTPDMNPQMKVLLRGIRSISQGSNNQPLFVLNGSPLSFGSGQYASTVAIDFINNLNPNDIEDVTILKGANGAALYGPEGANGVIIITTKKGNKVSNKPAVSFQTSTTFQRLDWRNEVRQRQFGPGNIVDQFGDPIYDPPAIGGWGPAFDGSMVQIGRTDENGNIQQVPYQYTNERRKFFDVARVIQNNLSVSSSDTKSDFYLGLNHTSQTGILPGDKKNQATLLLNTGRQLNTKAAVRLNIGYSRTNIDQGPEGLPRGLAVTPAHIPVTRYKDFRNDHWSDADHYWNDYSLNPYQMIKTIRQKSGTHALIGNLSLSYKVLPWLTVTDRIGLVYQGENIKSTQEAVNFSDWARNNSFIRFQPDGRGYGSLKEIVTSSSSINNDLLLQTNHRLADFTIRTTAGANIRENYIKRVEASATRLVVDVFNVDFNQFPARVEEYAELTRNVSFYGEATLGYKDKIFLSLTARNDWDSKLAKVARKKNFYAGVNTSLVLTEIFPGLSKLKWLDNARLRAAALKTALMNIEPYQNEQTYLRSGDFPYGNVLGYSPTGSIPNPFLKPEKAISQEYGATFSFLKERVGLDVSYYYQRNNGLIINTARPSYSGVPSVDNVGKFANYGWEFDLKANLIPKNKKEFSITVAGRFSINDNKLLELSSAYNGELIGEPLGGGGLGVPVVRVGSHAYSFLVFDFKRDPDGRVIVDRITGMPSVDFNNRKIRGRTLPKYAAGINLSVGWKKLRFDALAEYSGGNEHLFGEAYSLFSNGMHPLTTQNNRQRFVFPNSVYDDGTGKYEENKDIKVQSAEKGLYLIYAQASNFAVSSAAFWKIKELSFSYELSLKKGSTRKAVISIYGRDLFSFFPKSNISGDPQLIRGPGGRNNPDNQSVSAGSGGTNGQDNSRTNVSGASSDDNRLPGTVLYGFRINFSF